MAPYLVEHPPRRSQFREPRRELPSGAIVVHTSESQWAKGADPVAKFIRGRDEPGSYHTIVDFDSIVPLVPFSAEAFGEGTGGNRWALHLAFACHAHEWPTDWRWTWSKHLIEQGAQAAAGMASWVHRLTGVLIPAHRITRAEYRAHLPGFIGHGDVDPNRRTDPGQHFPWQLFLARYAELTSHLEVTDRQKERPMDNPYADECNEALQLLTNAGYYTGKFDGWFGPKALDALHQLKNDRSVGTAAAKWAAVEPHVHALVEWASDWDARAAARADEDKEED